MPWRIQFLHKSNNITNICNYYIIRKESSVWFCQEKKTCKSVWQLCRYRVSRLGLCPGCFLCRELIDSTELICCHAQETSGCGLTAVGQVCYYNIMRGLSTLGLIERWHFTSEILSNSKYSAICKLPVVMDVPPRYNLYFCPDTYSFHAGQTISWEMKWL